jgi:hypothetical protein
MALPAGGDLQTLITTLQLMNQQLGVIAQNLNALTGTGGAFLPISGGTLTGPLTFAASQSAWPKPIIGVTDGSNAAAGQVGEYIQATSSGVSSPTGTWINICSIVLTPGDWDVRANGWTNAQTGQSSVYLALSTTSAPTTSGQTFGGSVNISGSGMSAINLSIQSTRFNVTTNTTVWLQGLSTFTTGTGTMGGLLSARRVR